MSNRFKRATLAPRSEAEQVRGRITDSLAATQALLESDVVDQAAGLAGMIVDALEAGGKVLLFGNGGSAADATHIAAELVGRFRYDRGPLPALSLTDNGASITAIGNDYGYREVFARQVAAFGQPGDVAVGLSTSGRSENVLDGLRAARRAGLRTAALTGAFGGALSDEVELCLSMPVEDTARVQECTMLVGHIVCELVEQSIFPLA